jgi:hypothetical protein
MVEKRHVLAILALTRDGYRIAAKDERELKVLVPLP